MALDCSKLTSNSNTWLKWGSKGDQVTQLQLGLKQLGYYTSVKGKTLKVDGSFGQYTHNAVVAFQKASGNSQDGKVGPKTCKSFNEKLTTLTAAKAEVVGFDCPNVWIEPNKTNNTEHVRLLQTHLKTLGYYTSVGGVELKIDGDYGQYTIAAVKAFQKATGHNDDGVFGPATCPDLNKAINATKTLEASKAETTKKTEEVNKEIVIEADKYQFLPPGFKGNFHIDNVHFVSSAVEPTRRHTRGNWQTMELMNNGLYTYEGHSQPLEFDVTCYIRYNDYRTVKPALDLMYLKPCSVNGSGLTTGTYVVSYNIVHEYRHWWKLTFHLLQYLQGGC